MGVMCTHVIGERQAEVTASQVLEERVEAEAVKAAPGTPEVVLRLRLLPCLVVVHEVIVNTLRCGGWLLNDYGFRLCPCCRGIPWRHCCCCCIMLIGWFAAWYIVCMLLWFVVCFGRVGYWWWLQRERTKAIGCACDATRFDRLFLFLPLHSELEHRMMPESFECSTTLTKNKQKEFTILSTSHGTLTNLLKTLATW